MDPCSSQSISIYTYVIDIYLIHDEDYKMSPVVPQPQPYRETKIAPSVWAGYIPEAIARPTRAVVTL
jgi:hypothetical protein